MITTHMHLQPVPIPRTLTGADGRLFREMTEVRNRVYREVDGDDDDALTPEALRAHVDDSAYTRRLFWLVREGEAIVGRAGVVMPTDPASRVAEIFVELLRSAWGRGIGTAALSHLEQVARDNGRDVLQGWTRHPADEVAEGFLPAPTGFGGVPRDHTTRFLLAAGYRLEQVDRVSAFDMTAPAHRLHELLHQAQAAASDYRVVSWLAPAPAEFVSGYAWMKSRMSTDAPAAEFDVDEEVWDEARVRAYERTVTDSGRLLQVTAAQHVPSGDLCAFNELTSVTAPDSASWQQDTLVLREHRGHRLGMLVKCAGLLAWRERMPLTPRVVTENAEENRPMLDINETIGFAPVAAIGAWQKRVGPSVTPAGADSAGRSGSSDS
jgi:GNAT superfamily N-acetyltransferase